MIEYMEEACPQQAAKDDPYSAIVDLILFKSFSGRLACQQPDANTNGGQNDQAVPTQVQVTNAENYWVKCHFEHPGLLHGKDIGLLLPALNIPAWIWFLQTRPVPAK